MSGSSAPRGFSGPPIRPEEVDGLTVEGFVEILGSHRFVILLFTVLGLLASSVWVHTRPTVYTASALVMKKQQRSPLQVLATEAGSMVTADVMASEMELIRSRSVLSEVGAALTPRRRLDGPGDPVEWLRSRLEVTAARGTNLIRIDYTADDPGLAADVVNAVVEAYRSRSARAAIEEAVRRREFLAHQVAGLEDSVRVARERLADYQETSLVMDPAVTGTQLSESLRGEDARLRQLRYEASLVESLMTALDGSDPAAEGLERIVAATGDLLPGAQAIHEELRRLEGERTRLTAARYGYREESTPVLAVDSLIAKARRDLYAIAGQSLTLLRRRVREGERRIAELRREVADIPSRAAEISRLEQTAEAVQATFQTLAARYHEAQIAEAVVLPDVEVVDMAVPPRAPDPRSWLGPLLLSLIVGFGVGFGVAVLREKLSTVVRRVGDAESAAELELLAVLPELESPWERGDPAPLVVARGEGPEVRPEVEAFHALRTSLCFAWRPPSKVLAVTSQGPQEGKSFTAANLSLSLAQQGVRVLLVDADLRRPRQHRNFQFDRSPGLSDVLDGSITPAECLRPVEGTSVWVMPAGSPVANPALLLSGAAFERLLRWGRQGFDLVVVDTPPVLAVSETLSIATLTDGVVVVVRPGRTNRIALGEAADRLRRVGVRLLGLIVNAAPLGSGRVGYMDYRYRYYTYGEYAGDAA